MSFDPKTGGPRYLADIRRGAPQQIAQVLRDHEKWGKRDEPTGTVGMDDQGLADNAAPDADVLAVRPDCLGEEMKDFIDYVIGNDDSELAKVKAERDYALHCLEREIAINADTSAQLVSARKALEPFAMNVGAISLSKALGHISREHLLAAKAALTNCQ